MDFDFALVLVALTFLAALGWVYDRVMLSANRRQRIAVAAAQAAEMAHHFLMIRLTG